MLMPAQRPPSQRGSLYSLGARDVRDESLKFVHELKVMLNRGYSDASIARAFEVNLTRAINAERKELAALARELDVDVAHPEIRAVASRSSSEGIAQTTINVCRGLFARLCVERIGG